MPSKFRVGRLYPTFYKLPIGPRRNVSVNPAQVESVAANQGGTRVRMASGAVWQVPLSKREVFKLLGARQR